MNQACRDRACPISTHLAAVTNADSAAVSQNAPPIGLTGRRISTVQFSQCLRLRRSRGEEHELGHHLTHRRARPDELVPSRYALRVGDIDVMVISDGVLPITTVTMATNAAPADLSAWLKDMYLPQEMIDWPLNVAVVRSGGKTILIDSGLGTEFPDFPRAGQLAMRLVAAGIDPASVTDVVLTHLHMDHIGGLLVDGLRNQLRPDLRVHLASAEAEFWEAPDFSRTVMPAPIPDVLRRTAAQFLDVYRSQLRPFETEYEVAPGVLIRRTGGHTPGHSIVRLESGGEATDVRRRRRVPARVRQPRVAQRLRTRPRGISPRPGPSLEGACGERRATGGHSPAVPVRLPRGGRRRRLPVRTGRLGLLTALRLGPNQTTACV